MGSFSLSDAGYLLFVVPGGVLIWSYRHFTRSKAHMGELEYAIWSFIWGFVVFFVAMAMLAISKQTIPDVPLNNPAALLGSFSGLALGLTMFLSLPLGVCGAWLGNNGLFKVVDRWILQGVKGVDLSKIFRKKDKKRDPLFIRVLKWASDRGSAGFRLEELKSAVTSDDEEWIWVKRMMLGEIQGDPPLIFHLGNHHTGGGEYKYFLTGSGASALMDYLELNEARNSSRSAMRWAIASFSLAAVVGLVQIFVGVAQIYLK